MNIKSILPWILLAIVFFCIGIGIGFAVGKNKYDKDEEKTTTPTIKLTSKQLEKERFKKHKTIFDQMKAENIKENLRYLTKLPHSPGSERNKELGENLLKKWKEQGFDKAESFKYNIYLSNPKAPGEISIWNGSALERKLVINTEPPYDKSERDGTVLYPFNAFSGAGSATGELVYGNYGRDSDFKDLEDAGIDVAGKIMIFRYGKTSRSLKVKRSELRGVLGVIIYSDPYDHTYPGEEYPHGWMLNRYAVQRGTINRLPGDALSLGYPSKDGYFRKSESKYSGNPKIPSQPISYAHAYEILRSMKNTSIPLPSGFQGGLNFTYALTSGEGRNVTVKVSTELETKESYTICATLYGSEEPDRYVLIGNHRDAWTYGASDPSSGTATMMEIVRILGNYKKTTGWRPKRSIMACSWGTEEPGILGSTEWADENHKFLTHKVALYINVDMAVEGNFTLRIKALKMVSDSIYSVTKEIEAPDDASKTLYEDWLIKSARLKNTTVEKLKKPSLSVPASGSDYKALWHTYGTTMTDLRYLFSKIDYPRLPQNPHYHTMYESFGWMSKFVDPEYKYHLTIGKLWMGQALRFADADIIPFDLQAYMEQVKEYFDRFEKKYRTMLKPRSISLAIANQSLNALIAKTKQFHEMLSGMKNSDYKPYKLRAINDKIMNFEKNFILSTLSSETLSARHVVFATTGNKLYSEKFPGISEAIFFASKDPANDWDEVRKQITLVAWCFDTANRSLNLDESTMSA
ncbi:N-acetylated-alpha-linked acidic dipeptidase 2-like [Hydractinia symbiolongicarpus]|uniref:N-acetylated-alpha-linked acidic dipeptidase 2-like n=1 Tax=Hydractinia symbiolongicarpus TaxID=13093 RepID=UPI00254FDEBD|nr:N-acetylated-alpha-linked acidic dipeptidase 2-like [Hydractinia symbiolongicarpus]